MSDAHFFIVGAGRSGTTLLRNVLSAHSRLAVAPETHFMKRAEEDGPLDGVADDFEKMWRRLISWVRFQDLGIDAEELRARIEACGDRSFRNLFDTMLRMYGETTRKPRIGEKTPSHTRYLSTLLSWFPDARAIALQRDPRAVVASQLKTPWGLKQVTRRSIRGGVYSHNRLNAVTSYAKVWSHFYGEILPLWANDPRVCILRYEDMVAEPEKSTLQICRFLDEKFEPQMLADRSAAPTPQPMGTMHDEAHDRWRKRHASQSAKPITTSSLEKWRNDLTPLEIGVIEARCAIPMRQAGYKLESRPLIRHVFDASARLHNGLGRLETAWQRRFS